MSTVFKGLKVIDSLSEFNNKYVDIVISPEGFISEIKESQEKTASCISPGWVDLRSYINEPGNEAKDTLESLCMAANRGGFTHIAGFSASQPSMQHKNQLDFVRQQAKAFPLHIHCVPALTKNKEGLEMNELEDLHFAGAIAFSDSPKPNNHLGVLQRTLLYLQRVKGLVIVFPFEKQLAEHGQMHEGHYSVLLGMKGIPALAEELAIMQALEILRYTSGKIHFSSISTSKSVDLIREAKKEGLQVTCDCTAAHLFFRDSDMISFDSHLKVNPPFRSDEHVEALWKGLKDGSIDGICSAHSPENIENKELEFDLASFGMLGLETHFPSLNTLLPNSPLSLQDLVEILTNRAKKVLGLPLSSISAGTKADFCIFNTELEQQVSSASFASTSKNSPYIGKTLKGKVLAVGLGAKIQQF